MPQGLSSNRYPNYCRSFRIIQPGLETIPNTLQVNSRARLHVFGFHHIPSRILGSLFSRGRNLQSAAKLTGFELICIARSKLRQGGLWIHVSMHTYSSVQKLGVSPWKTCKSVLSIYLWLHVNWNFLRCIRKVREYYFVGILAKVFFELCLPYLCIWTKQVCMFFRARPKTFARNCRYISFQCRLPR